jgi:hypothetical protein
LSEVEKRLSGMQRAFQRRDDEKKAELERVTAELEQQRAMYEAIATKDMTAEERQRYDHEKEMARVQAERQEVQEWARQLEEREGLSQWKAWYADVGVPPEKLARANTWEEIQDAARAYMEPLLRQPQTPAPPSPPPSAPGPGDKVQTGTGAAPPSTELEELLAEGVPVWSKKFKDYARKAIREKRV